MILGLVSDAIDEPVLYSIGNSVPSHLDLTVKKTERCALIDQSTSVGTGTGKSLDMLTVSLRVQKQLAQGLKVGPTLLTQFLHINFIIYGINRYVVNLHFKDVSSCHWYKGGYFASQSLQRSQ